MGGRLDYLSCSIRVSCRILSHMCSNWYLPRFLFKERSFTLINVASLMFLEVPLASVYDVKAVWAYWMACRATVLMDGRWSLEVFFDPVSKSPPRFTNVCLWAVDVRGFEMVDDPTLLSLLSLSFGLIGKVLKAQVPSKCTCIPLDLHTFLNFSLIPWM